MDPLDFAFYLYALYLFSLFICQCVTMYTEEKQRETQQAEADKEWKQLRKSRRPGAFLDAVQANGYKKF